MSEKVLITVISEDDFSRPIAFDPNTGERYVDVNCGSGTPDWHTVTPDGEPLARAARTLEVQGFHYIVSDDYDHCKICVVLNAYNEQHACRLAAAAFGELVTGDLYAQQMEVIDAAKPQE